MKNVLEFARQIIPLLVFATFLRTKLVIFGDNNNRQPRIGLSLLLLLLFFKSLLDNEHNSTEGS